MFVGHFGIAELGKATRRELPILWLAVAAYLPDLTRFVLPIVTKEQEIYSHAIPAVMVMGLVIGALWKLRGGSLAGAAVIASVCFLHWPADFFTGCKPTMLDGPWVGLGSYRHPVSDLAAEGALLVLGWICVRRRANPSFSRWWLWGGAVLQLLFMISMYWGSEFYIGRREWTWKPDSSLVPVPHSYETATCKAPAGE
jgi:hypothetical protein